MLDSLVGRVDIVAEAGPNARDFIGGNIYSDATPADEDPAIGALFEDRLSYSIGVVGVIDGSRAMGSEVGNTDVHASDRREEGFFEFVAPMVACDCDFQESVHETFLRGSVWPPKP